MVQSFQAAVSLPGSAEDVFAWHAREGAFERLTPPWEAARVVERSGGLSEGSTVRLRVGVGPFSVPWHVRHERVKAGRGFDDVQVFGPFASWRHQHNFEPISARASRLVDSITYAPYLEALVGRLARAIVQRRLERMFRYRHTVTLNDLTRHLALSREPLRILVTGAGGLVGSRLVPFLTTGGHAVTRVVRRPSGAPGEEIVWDMAKETFPRTTGKEGLEGFDAVVHLAGENIAAARWTRDRKHVLVASRVDATHNLCNALASLRDPPETIVSASGIGIFGDRGEATLGDQSAPGSGFLAELAQNWEAALQPARAAGMRCVSLRFGMILSGSGGALQKLVKPFSFGLGGRVGSGKQWQPWIALDDVLGAILFAIVSESLNGGVNCVAPEQVRNEDFTRALAGVLGRPALFPLPALGVRTAFGSMGVELLLASQKANPTALLNAGFTFQFPTLDAALRHELGR